MLGRLPWFAFDRRRRALRFLVFFDMGGEAIAQDFWRHRQRQILRQRALASAYGVPSVLVVEQT
jgi:hypothetical protein